MARGRTDARPATIAEDLAGFVHGLSLDDLRSHTVATAKVLLIDALACTVAGGSSAHARIASVPAAEQPMSGPGSAGLVGRAGRAGPAVAALVNGAALRSLDLMDTYVGRDVTHPSEVVPAALACAEASGASGRTFLEAMVAGIALHIHLADVLELHRHGLHHVGHAAWVVPLVAGRLLNANRDETARALMVSAHHLVVPESFARGQLTNLKALAYPLISQQAIESVPLAQAGLTGARTACEEVASMLVRNFGLDFEARRLVPTTAPDLSQVTLKLYPAQYALQPLIAAAARASAPGLAGRIERAVVRASRRTVERTADPAKYAPSGPEGADHSLPFCIAAALIDGGLDEHSLQSRWRDADVLALMARTVAEPVSDDDGYAVGPQSIELGFEDGTSSFLACTYPPPGLTWRELACRKLRRACDDRLDPEAIIEAVDTIEEAPDLQALGHAVSDGRDRLTGGGPAT